MIGLFQDDFIVTEAGMDVHMVEYRYSIQFPLAECILRETLLSFARQTSVLQTASMVWKEGVVIQDPPLVILMKILNDGEEFSYGWVLYSAIRPFVACSVTFTA